MGTNFYFRMNSCASCSRYTEVHVGKRSAGWSFGFRAYPHKQEHPGWGFDPESPFGFPVLSRVDWRRVFTGVSGTLWDEYGRQVEESPLAWLDALVPPDLAQQRKENDLTSCPVWMAPRGWRDLEGFRFDAGEFS